MKIRGVEITKGDTITIYTKRGANVRGIIEEVDNSDGTIYVAANRKGGQPHSASGWYTPRVSQRGIPYCAE